MSNASEAMGPASLSPRTTLRAGLLAIITTAVSLGSPNKPLLRPMSKRSDIEFSTQFFTKLPLLNHFAVRAWSDGQIFATRLLSPITR
jgi:hypothetical protein